MRKLMHLTILNLALSNIFFQTDIFAETQEVNYCANGSCDSSTPSQCQGNTPTPSSGCGTASFTPNPSPSRYKCKCEFNGQYYAFDLTVSFTITCSPTDGKPTYTPSNFLTSNCRKVQVE